MGTVPTPELTYGHRVKEERDPQPRVASKPSSSSQSVVTYGKRVAVDKNNGESTYESYKKPYAKPTTIDNTGVVVAREAEIEVQANIHNANELLPESLIDRFTTKKGVPTTWREVIELRIGKQNASFRNNNPFGVDTIERIGK